MGKAREKEQERRRRWERHHGLDLANPQPGGHAGQRWWIAEDLSFQGWVDDPDRLVIAAPRQRPGTGPFITATEHRLFPPRTALNNSFELLLYQFGKLGFFAMSVPRLAEAAVSKVAEEFDLRLVPALMHLAYNTPGPGERQVMAFLSSSRPEEFVPEGFRLVRNPVPLRENVRGLEFREESARYRAGLGMLSDPDDGARDAWLIEQEVEAWHARAGLPWDAEAWARKASATSRALLEDLEKGPVVSE
jgi:hypothetical protein